MKTHLLYQDGDIDLTVELPAHATTLVQDLGLDVMFDAMANGDEFLRDVAVQTLLRSLAEPDDITYRQGVLTDCLEHSDLVRQIYDIAVQAIAQEKKIWDFGVRTPESRLRRSVQVLAMFLEELKRLRRLADEQAGQFPSDGFRQFFQTVRAELSDEYLAEVKEHLATLRFAHGVPLSARLGKGQRGVGYTVRDQSKQKKPWWRRLSLRPDPLTLVIAPRDDAGARALGELRDRGLDDVANAAAQSADHILSFFAMLRFELGFYLGCVHLHGQLTGIGQPVCVPVPAPCSEATLAGRGLYDPGLTLRAGQGLVGNELHANGRHLVVITGANQGGKSTFLRGVGLAQLMMQCGMFVPAHQFTGSVRSGVFTHFKREEDATLTSGKLDEELRRMSDLVDELAAGGLVLMNESFASTNESEGAQIGTAVIRAFLDADVTVVCVTHSYELASGLERQTAEDVVFLRAERGDDGRRTYLLIEAGPLPTSFGEDIYRQVFPAASTGAISAAGCSVADGHLREVTLVEQQRTDTEVEQLAAESGGSGERRDVSG